MRAHRSDRWSLEDVHLDEPFTLITTRLRDGKPDFRNTARHMLEALDADGRPIPTVVATRSATANLNRDFRRQGLEFDCGYGLFQYALDADNRAQSAAWDTPQGGCIAFALGVNEVLGGAPCESVPAVQDAWLAWLRVADRGRRRRRGHPDLGPRLAHRRAVRLRLQPRGAGRGGGETTEGPARPRPGERPDLATIARVRGDAYTQFLRRAREALRAAGLPLQVHLHTEAFRPSPVHGQLMGFPANLEFQWSEWLASGLVDSATLRTAWYERLGPPIDDLGELLAEPFVEETVAEARRHGVPLYLNRYAMDGNVRRTGARADRYLEDLEFAFRDERLDGFDLYELWALAGPERRRVARRARHRVAAADRATREAARHRVASEPVVTRLSREPRSPRPRHQVAVLRQPELPLPMRLRRSDSRRRRPRRIHRQPSERASW